MSIKLTQQEKLDILSKKNVVSVSIGYKRVNNQLTGDLAIVIGVTAKEPVDSLDLRDIIPVRYNEIVTDVIETDSEFRYLSPNCMDIDESNLSAGCSTHVSGINQAIKGGMQIAPDSKSPSFNSVGTLGAICRDKTDNKLVGLTNSHVLGQILKNTSNIDSSNPYLSEFVTTSTGISDISICQSPGQPTFSQYKRTVELDAYDIRTGVPTGYALQTVDGAIIDLSADNIGDRVVSPVIHSSFAATPLLNACPIYDFSGDITSLLGKRFIKVGRTTGSTPLEDNLTDIHGVIEGVDASVNLSMISEPTDADDQIRAIFDDCIKLKLVQDSTDVPADTANSSLAGDSGSCVFVWNNDRWEVIGLLFAGSTPVNTSTSPSYTMICRIDHVMKALSLGDNWSTDITTSLSDTVQSQPPTTSSSGNDYYSEISTGIDCHLWDGSIACDSVSEYIEIIDGDGQPLTYKRRDNTYNQANVHTHKISSSNVTSITEDDLRSITLYVDSGQYHIDNSITRDIYISRLQSSYKFILPTTTYNTHPLKIGSTIDNSSTEISTTVTTSGNNTIISLNINDIDFSYKKIYYFCGSHNNMGGNIYILHNPYNGNATY